jgi:cytochrome c553
VILAVLGAAGALAVVAGIVPIAASAGHWPITRWLLSFAMQRAVATHSLGVTAPSLDEPWLVLKGGAHYESGCRPCHGSPELRAPRIAQGMTPYPPYLPPVVSDWAVDELYYIVKHGVKFTGMPAWPAVRRDDEVWAMVAFLRRLPGLDALAYRRLVSGETPAAADTAGVGDVPRAVTESCARCHGFDGNGRGLSAFPKLAGQRPAYLLASLQAFARGQRHSGVMEPLAADLDLAQMRELTDYYASRPRLSSPAPGPDTAAARRLGETIAQHGIPGQRVPACEACHGRRTPRSAIYPELAGQYPEYLALQLMVFKDGARGGTPYAHVMRMVASRLTPEQMRAAALYYASLPAAPDHPEK